MGRSNLISSSSSLVLCVERMHVSQGWMNGCMHGYLGTPCMRTYAALRKSLLHLSPSHHGQSWTTNQCLPLPRCRPSWPEQCCPAAFVVSTSISPPSLGKKGLREKTRNLSYPQISCHTTCVRLLLTCQPGVALWRAAALVS